MREGLIEYIGTSAKLFVISVKEWREIHDLSAADFREYLAATASAFPRLCLLKNTNPKRRSCVQR
eukprot:3723211-Amphidinium_carterae.1